VQAGFTKPLADGAGHTFSPAEQVQRGDAQ